MHCPTGDGWNAHAVVNPNVCVSLTLFTTRLYCTRALRIIARNLRNATPDVLTWLRCGDEYPDAYQLNSAVFSAKLCQDIATVAIMARPLYSFD